MTYNEDNRIQLVPPLPSEIREAVNGGNLVVFIGAGVSQVIGCKSWGNLAQSLIDKCYSPEKDHARRYIDFKQKQTLLEGSDYKKTITMCYHILEENGRKDAFYKELEKCFKAKPRLLKSRNICKELIGLHGVFLTTNADRHFDKYFEEQRIVYDPWRLDATDIERNKLYHIHGSIRYPDSVVFILSKYMELYQESNFRKFLEQVFARHVVLFIGYGMSEFELLDFLMIKFDSSQKKESSRFILKGYYKGDEKIRDLDQYYYDEMGVRVIGYQMDNEGYGQLYEIVRRWREEIDQTSRYLYDSFDEIDEAINNP